ncbi:MAG: 3-phosphoglycerate dehydrogenase [Clostridia bacterium]|nr:3-phosphoglycerate dehydrogenase [Clostridia bacterium]
MYNILTLNKISKIGLSNLDASKYTCSDSAENPDAILVRSASMHEMKLDPATLAVARAGAGVNNIPVADFAAQGVVVFNTPGANANAVKELVICGLLLASRKIAAAIDWCKTLKGEGDQVGKLVEKGKSSFVGPEIGGKTLGVVGMGAIGALVADSAAALGMSIIGFDPFLSDAAKANFEAKGYKITADLDDIFVNSDYITLHLPFNDSTKGTINADTIAKMKDGVRIINFARGELVDSPALISALDSGKVAAYVTDFPTDAQIGHPGVTAIPHLGASTPESEDNCAVMATQEVSAYLEKGEIKNSVNYPNTDLPAAFTVRTCLLHNEDGSIADKAAEAAKAAGASVNNVFTAAKKGMGYTVIDTDREFDTGAIENVIRARILK